MNPSWKHAMDKKMDALHSREIWDLVVVHLGSDIVGYRWLFTAKY